MYLLLGFYARPEWTCCRFRLRYLAAAPDICRVLHGFSYNHLLPGFYQGI